MLLHHAAHELRFIHGLAVDVISEGRAARKFVTTADPAAAAAFGRDVQEDHARRDRRANEFAKALLGLGQVGPP